MRNPEFRVIDDSGKGEQIDVLQAVAEPERAFNITEYSNVLLAVETRTKCLCILKASRIYESQEDSYETREALESEAKVWQELNAPGHRYLVQLLPVKSEEYIARDKETRAYFLAEPYYAGYTIADLITPLSSVQRVRLFLLRWLNYRLLVLTILLGRHPRSSNLLPRFLYKGKIPLLSSAKINEGRPLPVTDSIEIVRAIADLLCYIHQRGYVHGDLKPSNILYRRIQWPGWKNHRQLVVVDYGAARRQGEKVTATTPGWSPPEDRRIFANSSMDIYAAGRILAYLLTGQRQPKRQAVNSNDEIHEGDDTDQPHRTIESFLLTADGLRFPWYLPKKSRALCTKRINVLLYQLLAEDPEQDIPTASELKQRLEEIQEMTTKRLGIAYATVGFLVGCLLTTVALFLASSGLRNELVSGRDDLQSEVALADTSVDDLNSDGPDEIEAATSGGADEEPVLIGPVTTDTPTPPPTTTPTPTLSPTPTFTAVPVNPSGQSRSSVTVLTEGDQNLQRCSAESNSPGFFGSEVKIRFRIEPAQSPSQFEVQIQGGDLAEVRTVVGRQPVGPAFSSLGGGEYQYQGAIPCNSIGCNLERVYQWRVRLTDMSGNERGVSDWCYFKFAE